MNQFGGYAFERKVEYEVKLLHREMDRQDRLSPLNHDSACACWFCIGRLQANVVQAYVRRMRELQEKGRSALDNSATNP